MTRYTWTVRPGTRTRVYRDAAREIYAVITPSDLGGWDWAVEQWERDLAHGNARHLADARTDAENWILACTEVTPA